AGDDRQAPAGPGVTLCLCLHERGSLNGSEADFAGRYLAALRQQSGDSVDDLTRFPFEARAGDPDHLDLGQLQLLLAEPVALEGAPRAVGLEGVQFHREALLGPVDVELEADLVEASRGPRQPGLRDQVEEATLQAGASKRGGLVEGESSSQCPGAVMAGVAGEDRFDG